MLSAYWEGVLFDLEVRRLIYVDLDYRFEYFINWRGLGSDRTPWNRVFLSDLRDKVWEFAKWGKRVHLPLLVLLFRLLVKQINNQLLCIRISNWEPCELIVLQRECYSWYISVKDDLGHYWDTQTVELFYCFVTQHVIVICICILNRLFVDCACRFEKKSGLPWLVAYVIT